MNPVVDGAMRSSAIVQSVNRRIRNIGAVLALLSVLASATQPGDPWVSIAFAGSAVGLVLIVTGVVRDIRSGA